MSIRIASSVVGSLCGDAVRIIGVSLFFSQQSVVAQRTSLTEEDVADLKDSLKILERKNRPLSF